MFTPTMGQADPQEADGEGRQAGKTHKSRRLEEVGLRPQEADGEGRQAGKTHKSRRLEEVGLRRRRLQGGAGQIARRRAQKGAQKGARKKGGSEGRVGKRGAGGRPKAQRKRTVPRGCRFANERIVSVCRCVGAPSV